MPNQLLQNVAIVSTIKLYAGYLNKFDTTIKIDLKYCNKHQQA